ncbi:hypothetical protein RJ640_002391 [Escallonia rubra]|uniref:Uncharacterized protein n=1 Tax=Escallonia rubra TaxID=112253 RepID=A0AA88UGY1_9ASTE|nr:hypothetical protein RJ640_002391 [Escallonia rubra]
MLDELPPIFVGKAEELKRVVRLMCSTTKESMKTMEMHMLPWRRYGYVLEKWFGLYKRTTSEAPLKKASDSEEGSARKRAVGFAPLPAHSYYCRGDFVSKAVQGGRRRRILALEIRALPRYRVATQTNAKSKSKKFPPPHQDGAVGYPLDKSHNGPLSFGQADTSFGSSFFDPRSSRSVKNTSTTGGAFPKEERQERRAPNGSIAEVYPCVHSICNYVINGFEIQG